MFNTASESEDNSLEFLSIIILLHGDNFFNIKSLLGFACNHTIYSRIHRYLFQLTSPEALKHQILWLRNAVFDFQTRPHKTASLNTLKGSAIKDELISRWLTRTNITLEMYFYGLLYSARVQSISLKLTADDSTLLSRTIEAMKNDSIQLKIFLPYVFPFFSQETITNWVDRPICEDLDDYLTSPKSMPRIKEFYDFFGEYHISVTDQAVQLYERILDTMIEEFLNNFHYTIYRNDLMGIILYKDLFLPKIKLENIQEKFAKILNFLKKQEHEADWRFAGISHVDPKLNSEAIAWKILTLLIPYIPEKRTAIIQLIDEKQINIASIYMKLGLDQIWVALVPYLQSKELDTFLSATLESFIQGKWQERLGSLGRLLGRLKFEQIEAIYDKIGELFKKDISLCNTTGLFERFFFNTPEKEKSKYNDYFKLLSIVVPYFKPEQIGVIRQSLKEMITLALSELPDFQIDDDCIPKRKDQKKLLSYLKREQIQEVYDNLLKKIAPNQKSLILILGIPLLSTFLPNLEPDRIESLLIPILQLAKDEDTSLQSIGIDALTQLAAWSSPKDIDKIYAYTLSLLKKNSWRSYSQVLNLLSSLVHRFQGEQIQTALNDLMLVVKIEKDKVRQIACEGLVLLSPYLFDKGIEQLFGILPALSKDSNPVICQTACHIIKVIAPRLPDEQAQTAFTELLAVMETREEKILSAACGALVKLPSSLLLHHTELLQKYVLKLLQVTDISIRWPGYEILRIISQQMQKLQIAEVLPVIQKSINEIYTRDLREYRAEFAPLSQEMMIQTYSTVTLFLPKLEQKHILSLLPPIHWLSNTVDDKAGLAIAHFINKAIIRIDFQLISEKDFLHNPLLILMKLMYQFSEQMSSKKNSVPFRRAQPSFFSEKERIQPQEIVPPAVFERKFD